MYQNNMSGSSSSDIVNLPTRQLASLLRATKETDEKKIVGYLRLVEIMLTTWGSPQEFDIHGSAVMVIGAAITKETTAVHPADLAGIVTSILHCSGKQLADSLLCLTALGVISRSPKNPRFLVFKTYDDDERFCTIREKCTKIITWSKLRYSETSSVPISATDIWGKALDDLFNCDLVKLLTK